MSWREHKILQVMPAPEHVQIAYVDADGQVIRYPAACLALVESWRCPGRDVCEYDACPYRDEHSDHERTVEPLDVLDGRIERLESWQHVVSPDLPDDAIREIEQSRREQVERSERERAALAAAGWTRESVAGVDYWQPPGGGASLPQWQASKLLREQVGGGDER